jgi:hypothetical protein
MQDISTEDEVFRKLKKPPFNKMREYFIQWASDNHIFPSWEDMIIQRDKFFESHGWTLQEYKKEREKIYD